MLSIAAFAGLLLAATSPASADGEVVLNGSDLKWARRPSGDDMAWVYPDYAARRGIDGSATLKCRATAELRLADCAVVEEAPEGLGFGEAAVKLGPRFKLKRKQALDTSLEDAAILISIRFVLFRP